MENKSNERATQYSSKVGQITSSINKSAATFSVSLNDPNAITTRTHHKHFPNDTTGALEKAKNFAPIAHSSSCSSTSRAYKPDSHRNDITKVSI